MQTRSFMTTAPGRSPLRAVAIVATIGAAFVLTGCAAWQSPRYVSARELEVDHAADQPIQVETANGSVHLRRADVERVFISAEIGALTQERLDQIRILTKRSGSDGLRISVQWPEGGRKGGERASFDIRTPGATGVRVRSSNGRITLRGLAGHADLGTSNGRIEVYDHDGEALADTSNGRLRFERVTGDIIGDTSNGRINVVDAGGGVDIRSSNGQADVRFAPDAAGPLRIHTSNGSVAIALPRNYAGEMRCSTTNGGVSFDLGRSVRSVSQSKNRATFVVGEGGAVSEVRSSNGKISIRSLD